MLKLIVAVCEGNGIGKGGNLPWRLKSEMAYFARMTKTVQDPSKRNAVIMGRRTWQSIPDKFRPLKDRFNIVLSSMDKKEITQDSEESVAVCRNFKDALSLVDKMADDNQLESCWIIGGSSVYAEAMNHERLDRIYLTQILSSYDCDTFLPPVDTETWTLVSDPAVSNAIQEENNIQYKYLVYGKKCQSQTMM